MARRKSKKQPTEIIYIEHIDIEHKKDCFKTVKINQKLCLKHLEIFRKILKNRHRAVNIDFKYKVCEKNQIMKIFVKKIQLGFVPIDEEQYEIFQKIGEWEGYINIVKQRNVGNHRRFFKMLNTVYQNQDFYNNIDHLRKILTMKAGYFDTVITSRGTTYLPKSIAFDKLDEIEFREFFNRFIDAVLEEFKYNDEEYEKILRNFVN